MSFATWGMDKKIAMEMLTKGIGAALWFLGGALITRYPYIGFGLAMFGCIPLSITVSKVNEEVEDDEME